MADKHTINEYKDRFDSPIGITKPKRININKTTKTSSTGTKKRGK